MEGGFTVRLELPDREGYRFQAIVHLSRIKLRREHPERPSVDLTVEDRLDFDKELLPEDSW